MIRNLVRGDEIAFSDLQLETSVKCRWKRAERLKVKLEGEKGTL